MKWLNSMEFLRNTISIGKVVNDLMKLEDIDIIWLNYLKEKYIPCSAD